MTTHALGDAAADEADASTDHLRQHHNHEIANPLNQGMQLRSESVSGFQQQGDLALPPAQLTEFLVTRFESLHWNDAASVQLIEGSLAFVELDWALNPVVPTQLTVQLVA